MRTYTCHNIFCGETASCRHCHGLEKTGDVLRRILYIDERSCTQREFVLLNTKHKRTSIEAGCVLSVRVEGADFRERFGGCVESDSGLRT